MRIGQYYYFITDKGTVGKAQWLETYKDYYRKNIGNVYTKYFDIKDKINKIKLEVI
jgi:hypothetical protein